METVLSKTKVNLNTRGKY